MAWDRIKSMFGRADKEPASPSDLKWTEAAESPWGVRVLDVTPITLTMLSTSKDPQCATNAVSYGSDDGRGFIGAPLPVTRSIPVSLRFPIDRMLADGVLFIPREMEHKWAIFFHQGEVIFVRSWLRQVVARARIEKFDKHVEITQVFGTFADGDEEPEFTARTVDYLLRSHALATIYPAPLLKGNELDPRSAALWCMSMFGNKASFATAEPIPRIDPDVPLRTHSLLHIAVARGNVVEVDAQLGAGVPIDLLAADGLAPLHWAIASKDMEILTFLIDRGSPVDVRSFEGATPLMNAVQGGSVAQVELLIKRGADVDARDLRGFTALHRAAEMGHFEIAKCLLDHGATLNPEAQGYTPLSFAEGTQRADIVALLKQRAV